MISLMGELQDESVQPANAEGSGKAPYKIDQCTFANRLKALYSHWRKRKDELWGSADFIAISTPPKGRSYLRSSIWSYKSSAFVTWLLGYEFPETTLVFGSKHIYFLCNQTKASLLDSVKGSAKEAVDVDVVIHTKLEGDDGTSKMDDVLYSMLLSKSEVHDAPFVGYIFLESPKGSTLEKWAGKLNKFGFQLSDVTCGVSDLLWPSSLSAVNDPNEASAVKKIVYLTASAMKYFVIPNIRRAIGSKESTEKVVSDPARIKLKLNADNVDISFPPIFESGGKFDIRRVVQRNNDYFLYESPNLIICAIGSQYNNYCYVARTYLIDANAFQITAYKLLLRAYEAAIKAFKPGYKLSAVYSAAHEVVKKVDPVLVPNLTMTVGTCFGVALREPGLPGNLVTDRKIKAGADYNLSLGFQNVLTDTGNLKGQTFSLLLGDTVFVGNGEPIVRTHLCSKDVKEVVYSSDDTKEAAEPRMKIVYSGNIASYSKIRHQSGKREISKKERLRHFQAELAQQKNEETPKRLAGNWANLMTSDEHIGSRYDNFCSNVARNFLIDANAVLSKAYTSLGRAHEAATYAVTPGSKMRDVYIAAVAVVEMSAPELVPNLTKTAGTCIGLEFGKSGLALDLKNDHVIKAGMFFKISIGFQNLLSEAGNPRSQIFLLLLEDLVLVTNSGRIVVTQMSSKDVKDVTYSLSDAKEESEFRVEVQKISKVDLGRPRRPWAELDREKKEEAVRRLAGWGSAPGDNRGSLNTSYELIAYKSVKDLPPTYKLTIQVHYNNEAVLLPINGMLVPFHIATVKRVSSMQGTNNNCYIRIVFNVPGTPFTPRDDANSLKSQGSIYYLKEASFHSKDPERISFVVKQIKTLRSVVIARECKRAERALPVGPEMLELDGNNCKPIRLCDLWIHPPFDDDPEREMIGGVLEAHVNGFRYSTSRQDEAVDIMYANIKHALFQPAEDEKEMITLLHFNLHEHVMIGNTKTRDVQLYVDVVQMLGGEKPSYHSSCETDEERKRKRDCRCKITMDFQKFVNNFKVQPQLKELDLEFEQPMRKLGFHGIVVPYNNKASSAFIVPTSSCLVELTETPFLVITLSEIEIVNLERIGGVVGQKDFDMAIVFKDFKRDFMRIDSIPATSFDGIIEWLDGADIAYYVNRRNRNWRAILTAFSDDPQVFKEVGGWDFLKQEAASCSDTDTMSDCVDGDYDWSDYEPESPDTQDFDDYDEDSSGWPLVDLGVLGKFRSVLCHL